MLKVKGIMGLRCPEPSGGVGQIRVPRHKDTIRMVPGKTGARRKGAGSQLETRTEGGCQEQELCGLFLPEVPESCGTREKVAALHPPASWPSLGWWKAARWNLRSQEHRARASTGTHRSQTPAPTASCTPRGPCALAWFIGLSAEAPFSAAPG